MNSNKLNGGTTNKEVIRKEVRLIFSLEKANRGPNQTSELSKSKENLSKTPKIMESTKLNHDEEDNTSEDEADNDSDETEEETTQNLSFEYQSDGINATKIDHDNDWIGDAANRSPQDQEQSNMTPNQISNKGSTEQDHDHTNTDEHQITTNYEAKSYCVKIFCKGLNNPKYIGDVQNRFREIKKRTGASRVISSSIQKCTKTKQIYSKVVTDNLNDYNKLLSEWPLGSFDSQEPVTVEKEYIEVNEQILDVPKDTNIELDKNTLDSLREQGLRNIMRSSRFDFSTQRTIDFNKLNANVKDFDTLKRIFEEGIAIQCLKSNHDVVPALELVRICKTCGLWDHRTKNCENRKACIKCSVTGHDFTECPNPTKLKCMHCGLGHEAGSFRCKTTYLKNVEKNKFFCEFMTNENLRSNNYAVLNCPVPDGMHNDDEIQLDNDKVDEQRNEIYDTVDAYLKNMQGLINQEIRKDLDTLRNRVNNHENRLQTIETDIKKLDENVKSLRDEFIEKTDSILTEVRENGDQLKNFTDEVTSRIVKSDARREKELTSLHNEMKLNQDQLMEAILRRSNSKRPRNQRPEQNTDIPRETEPNNYQ